MLFYKKDLILAKKHLKFYTQKCHNYIKTQIKNDDISLPEAMEIASKMKYDLNIMSYFFNIKNCVNTILKIKKEYQNLSFN